MKLYIAWTIRQTLCFSIKNSVGLPLTGCAIMQDIILGH